VHYVTEQIDAGPVISQGEVDVFEDDTAEILHSRIQRAEHVLYPMVLEYFSQQFANAESK
jgi:phosphoribosylglycinamide formyltransferase-1